MSMQSIFQKEAHSDPNQTHRSADLLQPIQQSSNTRILKGLDQRCDDKQTLLTIISDLYEEFLVPGKKEWVLLEGDKAMITVHQGRVWQ